MAGTAIELTDADFAELTSTGVALVDFWGPHCPPCRVQGPIVDKVTTLFSGRASVSKLDVESNPKVPTEFGLMYIPTLIIFKEGKELKRFTGLTQEATLVAELQDALKEA